MTLADSVETLGVDLRTRVNRLGAREKARRTKCKVSFSIIKKNKAFRKIESGCQEVATCRHDAIKDLGSPCGWDVSHGEVKIEETDGNCRRKKKSTTSLSLLMEVYGLEVEDEIPTRATQFWAEGVWTGKWNHEQKEA